MAVTCGLAFSGMGLAERTLEIPDPWWHVFGGPTPYALIGYGAGRHHGVRLGHRAGQGDHGDSVTFAVETVVPSVIGLIALDDSPRPGFAVVAVAGFVATVGGAIGLTRVAAMTEAPVATEAPSRWLSAG